MILLKAKDASHSIEERESFIQDLRNNLPESYIYLQTCDRVELYTDDNPNTKENIFLEKANQAIIRHLFRLAAGLESPLIGETQILHQVKEAYTKMSEKKVVSTNLHLLFQHALRVGKLVRSETGISKGAMSHSQAVVDILKKLKINLSEKKITILGAHHLNRKIIQYLVKNGSSTIFVSNRTYEKAKALSEEFQCEAFNLEDLEKELIDTDILISATSSPKAIVHYASFPKNKEMIAFDLAVPRDIESSIYQLASVKIFNVEDIEKSVRQNISQRVQEIKRASEIIETELEKLKHLQTFKNPSPT